jgi:hypothetical protein
MTIGDEILLKYEQFWEYVAVKTRIRRDFVATYYLFQYSTAKIDRAAGESPEGVIAKKLSNQSSCV